VHCDSFGLHRSQFANDSTEYLFRSVICCAVDSLCFSLLIGPDQKRKPWNRTICDVGRIVEKVLEHLRLETTKYCRTHDGVDCATLNAVDSIRVVPVHRGKKQSTLNLISFLVQFLHPGRQLIAVIEDTFWIVFHHLV